ncbi:hypothetical protein, partial [Kingella kingae]|uniref:hypothetical protein n=1 Tax=Kingella kingae TaxID=504 RepID=UPI00254C4C5E
AWRFAAIPTLGFALCPLNFGQYIRFQAALLCFYILQKMQAETFAKLPCRHSCVDRNPTENLGYLK